jgi:hypothetical protein
LLDQDPYTLIFTYKKNILKTLTQELIKEKKMEGVKKETKKREGIYKIKRKR